MDCGKVFLLSEYLDEIDAETWERISLRACNRT